MGDETTFRTALLSAAECLTVSLSPEQADRMSAHYGLLVEANRQFNLTRVTAPADAAVKLYADSLAVCAWAAEAGVAMTDVLDVGSGAGFPAVPLAIARPRWQVTAMDSTGKKVRFIETSAGQLGLSNLHAVHARAGEGGIRDKNGSSGSMRYDLLTFKAIGPLDRCIAASRDLCRRDAHLVVFKSANITREEIDAGQRAAEQSGFTLWDAFDYDLPLSGESLAMTLFVFRRIA